MKSPRVESPSRDARARRRDARIDEDARDVAGAFVELDAMSSTPRAAETSAALEMFHARELSREARAKIELLERRLTTSERATPPSASRETGRSARARAGAERCAMEDSASDSSEDEGGGTRAYGVVDARANASEGKASTVKAEGVGTGASGNGGKKTTKRRRRESATASDLENENPERGGASGGLARSRRHPGGKTASARTPEANVSLLDRFENTGSGFKTSSPLVEAMTTPGKGTAGGEREAAATKIRALEEKLAATEKEREEYERGCEELRASNNELKREFERASEARRRGVHQLAVNLAVLERKQMRMQIAEEGLRLGTIGVQRVGSVLQEVWEDGRAFHELDDRLDRLTESRKLAEEKRKQVKKKLPPPGSAEMDTTAHAEYVLSEEVHKARMAIIRKEEEALKAERESLEREKAAHIRALKRVRDEDGSRFNKHPVLGDRYVLMNLLGRGGFSEVYKAWDSVEMREVACKLHQLNPQWSEERKRTYVRHAARECDIHKSLDHPHVVRLIDVFEVDSDSFCTVLELCTGDDLDARLKAQGSISEREARAILAQVFNGLAYMSTGPKRIIHYDLKPGNILFDEAGRVKITDFGLSKIMEERSVGFGADSGMELTSQGAGTYWYLPPECFETGPAPPKISSKVDTWSCGVILFQMIYGKRPFGHDMSQEQILHAGTIRNAKEVEFPSRPSISLEGKAFISRCLAYKQSQRPDVLEASKDPYMTFLTK